MSDDGQFGLSLIAFVGSVFSPYYAKAIRSGAQPNPLDHCALNVALYMPKTKYWAMTERPAQSVKRNQESFTIGPSSLHWDGQALHIDINEMSVPFFRRIQGRISVYPNLLFNFSTPLDENGLHFWGPIAPSSRVVVNLKHPNQSWTGHAYLDSNEGVEPIHQAFREWDWSRSHMMDNSCAVIYDCQLQNGADKLLALKFRSDGQIENFQAPDQVSLSKTGWKMDRRLRCEQNIHSVQQLEDTPFYQRAMIQNTLMGERVVSFHETLNAERFNSRWVQALLPWRMPRLNYPMF
jgi:carotenoid 1,2-hydratase